ncbi:MAG: glucan biosynthesis protein G [Mailhella sp.]|nr:glucan biosynthesis protein G [Mailhella sp.]
MFHRLILCLCVLVSAFMAPVQAQAAYPFAFADVQAMAQDLAGTPYVDKPSVPAFLTVPEMKPEVWTSIRFRPEKALWTDEGLPFSVQFFHPGLYYDKTVRIHVVTGDGVEDVAFDTSLFTYGDDKLAIRADQAEGLDFAGFRLHYALNRSDYKDELAIFLGASYFRALAKGSHYGIYSRGLALDTACAQGEEFPYFREFWIVKPAPDADRVVVYALTDSPTMAGAYCFTIIPGAPTEMDVKCALFTRQGAKNLEKIGLAPLTSMFFYGEEKNGRPDDFRPEIHNSDGLLFAEGGDRWTWCPLNNPRLLSVRTFPLTNPRGFGLMQRDGSFASYQDIDARYDLRPSLWVEPEGDWGNGTLNLVKIPTDSEMNDNIVAFWSPAKPRESSAPDVPEAELRYPDSHMYAWKLFWMAPGSERHELGTVSSTRISRSGDTMTFHIDFSGGELDRMASDAGIASLVETPESIPLLEKRLVRNPAVNGWRLDIKVRLPKEDGVLKSLMAARKGPVELRFRAALKKGENLPDLLTEVWTYDWQLNPQ